MILFLGMWAAEMLVLLAGASILVSCVRAAPEAPVPWLGVVVFVVLTSGFTLSTIADYGDGVQALHDRADDHCLEALWGETSPEPEPGPEEP